MAAAWRTWLAIVPVVALLGGCGSMEVATSGSAPGPTPAETTPVTMSKAFLEAVLLSRLDIRGSAEVDEPAADDEDNAEETPAAKKADATAEACLGEFENEQEHDANDVNGPTVLSGEGLIQRSYTSMGTQAPPAEVAAMVAKFASPEIPQCFLQYMKDMFIADPEPPRIDPSGLTAQSGPVAVGERGVLITISGNLKAPGLEFPMSMEMLMFHKGRAVIMVMSAAMPGAPFPLRITEMAQKVERRLL